MTKFNRGKTIKRNDFTMIFSSVGGRRIFMYGVRNIFSGHKRTKMQKIRRAHQGSKNRVFNSIHTLKIRLKFGRYKTTPQFRIYK